MHGANGPDKTAILKMINGFVNSRYSVLRSTPFSELGIDFDDESAVRTMSTILRTRAIQ